MSIGNFPESLSQATLVGIRSLSREIGRSTSKGPKATSGQRPRMSLPKPTPAIVHLRGTAATA